MQFKNFTLECYKLPGSKPFIGMFKILWTAANSTRFDWAIFDNENKSQEGVILNTLMSSNLSFSAELFSSKQYFVLLNEIDGCGAIVSRSWEFIDGSSISNEIDSNYTLSKVKSNQLVPSIKKLDNVNINRFHSELETDCPPINWPPMDYSLFDFPIYNNTPSGWIVPVQERQTSTFDFASLPNVTDEQKSPIIKSTDIEDNINGVVRVDCSSKDVNQELDDLIRQLEMMPIGELECELENELECELEDWEIELNKIIAELDKPFIRNKKIYEMDKIADAIVVENYLGKKSIDIECPLYANQIPIPPPLPSPSSHTSFIYTDSFKQELNSVRHRVMAKKIDASPEKSRRTWFSLFR